MKTLEEINKIREEKRKELDLRVNINASTTEKHILVCHGTGCTSSKSPKIIENFRKILEEKGITNVRVIQTGCFGLCAKGPIVIIRPEDTFYAMVKPEDCEEIIQTHIIEGNRVERLLCKDIDNKVVEKLDYSKGVNGLPKSDVVTFLLDNGSKIIVRPSGTEPKLKVYYSIKSASEKKAKAMLETIQESFVKNL